MRIGSVRKDKIPVITHQRRKARFDRVNGGMRESQLLHIHIIVRENNGQVR